MNQFVRRFYEHAHAVASADGYGVMLDRRALRTPGGAPVRTPTLALAEACAQEWQAQGERIAPATMPISQLSFAAIDHTPARRADLYAYVTKFAETDLCCHRAEAPEGLSASQAAKWDPLVAWGASALEVRLPVVVGIRPADTPPECLSALAAHAERLDDFLLTALAQAAGLSGSAVIAFALVRRQLDGAAAFAASALDELWSLEHWGEDEAARHRLDQVRAEFDALERFITAVHG